MRDKQERERETRRERGTHKAREREEGERETDRKRVTDKERERKREIYIYIDRY